jgi:hypothetical protein
MQGGSTVPLLSDLCASNTNENIFLVHTTTQVYFPNGFSSSLLSRSCLASQYAGTSLLCRHQALHAACLDIELPHSLPQLHSHLPCEHVSDQGIKLWQILGEL